jgi:hypothetical protein
MAETIITSPGVYISENNQTFNPQSTINIGAVIVGPTNKGKAFVPTIVQSPSEFSTKFGTSLQYNKTVTYVPQAVNHYLQQAGSVTVVRVLGGGGFKFDSSRKLAALAVSGTNEIVSVLYPSQNSDTLGLSGSLFNNSSNNILSSSAISGSYVLTLAGENFSSRTISASFNPNNSNYILNVLGDQPNNTSGSTQDNAFAYLNWRTRQSNISTANLYLVTSSATVEFTGSTSEGFDHGQTPWVTSGNSSIQLFKFHHLGDGFDTNNDVYISITNLQEPADVNGVPQFSKFTVLVRKVGDSDLSPSILENYNDCDLDPSSPQFIARMIGDTYSEYNDSLSKVVTNGEFNTISQYVRVEVSDDVRNGALSPKLSPRGHSSYYDTTGFAPTFVAPSASLQTIKTYNSSYNPNVFLGFDFTNPDYKNYLKAVPKVNSSYQVGANALFNIDVLNGHPSASWTTSLSASVDSSGITGPTGKQLQFNLVMQFGNDGIDFQTIKNVGANISSTNVFGLNLSSTTTAGGLAYNKALNILANTDAYNFDILTTPGVIDEFHHPIITLAQNMIEERGDAFYPIDLSDIDASVASAKNQTSDLDSSYMAAYYPWVKMSNVDNGVPEYFPPSVVVPGVCKRSDNISAPWFAPAGLTRGGIPGVFSTKNPLSPAERGILYAERVNPIAQFPGQGITIYGQKTLQRIPSALDRIGVRRLLIDLNKFIGSQSRYLVFEQNSSATRQRFLNVVNPYLQSIQDRQGVYAYRVVMDDSNNTSDVIDRNELVGHILIQPTRTAEFIKIGFTILPTGSPI